MEAFLQLFIGLMAVLAQQPDLPDVDFYDRIQGGLKQEAVVVEQPNHYYAAALEESGIKLSAEKVGQEMGAEQVVDELTRCKAVAYKTLVSLPSSHSRSLKSLTFTFDRDARRGYGGADSMILRCVETGDQELTAVMIHELGHIVDLGVINGAGERQGTEFFDGLTPIYNDDLSVDFYRISWKNSESKRSDASKLDFVSEYAMSDVFEDFAESYVFYVLHGGEFRKLAEMNVALTRKYDFLKDNVFGGKEFTGSASEANFLERPYDVTVLPYDYQAVIGLNPVLQRVLAQRVDK